MIPQLFFEALNSMYTADLDHAAIESLVAALDDEQECCLLTGTGAIAKDGDALHEQRVIAESRLAENAAEQRVVHKTTRENMRHQREVHTITDTIARLPAASSTKDAIREEVDRCEQQVVELQMKYDVVAQSLVTIKTQADAIVVLDD